MKYQTIYVNGYWKDDKQPFYHMKVALGDWDGVEDWEDETISFYLDGYPPLGEHCDFVITEIEEYGEAV